MPDTALCWVGQGGLSAAPERALAGSRAKSVGTKGLGGGRRSSDGGTAASQRASQSRGSGWLLYCVPYHSSRSSAAPCRTGHGLRRPGPQTSMHTPQHRPCCDASRSCAFVVSSASPQKQVLETNALAGRMLYHGVGLVTGGATPLCRPRRSRLGRLSPWTEQAPGWFELKGSTQELLRLDLLGLSRRQLAFPLGAGGREARRGCRAWNCLDVQTTRALPGVISRSTPRSAASSYSCGAPQRSVSGANRVNRAARAPCRVPRRQRTHPSHQAWPNRALRRRRGAPAARFAQSGVDSTGVQATRHGRTGLCGAAGRACGTPCSASRASRAGTRCSSDASDRASASGAARSAYAKCSRRSARFSCHLPPARPCWFQKSPNGGQHRTFGTPTSPTSHAPPQEEGRKVKDI